MVGIVLTLVFVVAALIILNSISTIKKLNNDILSLEKENVLLKSQNDHLKQQYFDTKESIKQSEQKLKLQFENFTNQILNDKSQILERETKNNITNLLLPLKAKIAEFTQKVDRNYSEETKEIFSLKNEINKLITNNSNMARETENLTNALKGNVKTQGIWGEVILEKVLESSGLREGEEYITQGRDLQLKSLDNKILRPDVIVNLPDNKHIIIDAKVSLTHYEKYIQALNSQEDNNLVETNLNLFIKSIQNHIANLSSKQYQANEQLLTPDFVILFLPIEGAFSMALQIMPDLLMQAWNNKIIITSPTTLLATLKTVASIWLFEKQNKNAILIARESGLLYDKFVAFTEDLTKIGQAISKSEEAYHAALNKLSLGRGNIINRAEKIKELGAKTSKKLKIDNQGDTDARHVDDSHSSSRANILETDLEHN